MTSGLLAAASIGASPPFEIILNGGYPTHRIAPPPPLHTKIPPVKLGRPIWTWKDEDKSFVDNVKGKVIENGVNIIGWSVVATMGLVGGFGSRIFSA